MKSIFRPEYIHLKDQIINCIANYNTSGMSIYDGNRNGIKIFNIENDVINIKSFKKPHFINKVIYSFFRKTKARRSYEYATILLEKGIGTPQPIAYFENSDAIGLLDSYYVSEQVLCDLTYRELNKEDYPDGENILRQFTKFTFDMHQKGIEFLDHSPGNTLIKNEGNGKYSFYLVDLNRMNFHQNIDFQTRMKNLSRLTSKKGIVAIMSDEYAKLSGEDKDLVFETMWKATQDFQYRFNRKKRIKRQLKFWKK